RGRDPVTHQRLQSTHSSPNRFATSVASASSAASASSPTARIVNSAPHSAASIMTPMMLLPFTSMSSLRSQISERKRLAALTNSAAGRACNPCLLTMRTVRSWSTEAELISASPDPFRSIRGRRPSSSRVSRPVHSRKDAAERDDPQGDDDRRPDACSESEPDQRARRSRREPHEREPAAVPERLGQRRALDEGAGHDEGEQQPGEEGPQGRQRALDPHDPRAADLLADPQPFAQPELIAQHPDRDVPGVVEREEHQHADPPRGPGEEDGQCEKDAEGAPPRPDEAVA